MGFSFKRLRKNVRKTVKRVTKNVGKAAKFSVDPLQLHKHVPKLVKSGLENVEGLAGSLLGEGGLVEGIIGGVGIPDFVPLDDAPTLSQTEESLSVPLLRSRPWWENPTVIVGGVVVVGVVILLVKRK